MPEASRGGDIHFLITRHGIGQLDCRAYPQSGNGSRPACKGLRQSVLRGFPGLPERDIVALAKDQRFTGGALFQKDRKLGGPPPKIGVRPADKLDCFMSRASNE